VCELALYCREKIDSDGLVDEATADNFRKKMMEFHRRFLDGEYLSSGLMIDVMIELDGISMELDITNPRPVRALLRLSGSSFRYEQTGGRGR
jgi:predicted DNA-binding helix-hairpin-helix protein